MFADVVGFTAWSSIREPTQVFTLLETIYGAFDAIARKRGVFKVRGTSFAEGRDAWLALLTAFTSTIW
jgi:class 3 adenylate cyclase